MSPLIPAIENSCGSAPRSIIPAALSHWLIAKLAPYHPRPSDTEGGKRPFVSMSELMAAGGRRAVRRGRGSDSFMPLIFRRSFGCVSLFNTALLNLLYGQSETSHPSPHRPSTVGRGGPPPLPPPLSPLPISPLFFSHNKSGPDFLKQTALWGPSPPITLSVPIRPEI